MLETDLIPAQESNSGKLMIVLHGLGDSMDGFRSLPASLQLPWLNYLLVNAPDGYYGGYSWFDIYENRSVGIKRSRELLFELLDDLPQKGFQSENTMLLGFSQGCLMSIEVGCRYQKLLAGIIGISGWPHEPEKLISERSNVALQQKFLISHGSQDTLVPFNEVKKHVEQLKTAGYQIDWHEYRKAHTIIEEEILVFRDFTTKCFSAR
jgi:phospholipase/carboxylesterase